MATHCDAARALGWDYSEQSPYMPVYHFFPLLHTRAVTGTVPAQDASLRGSGEYRNVGPHRLTPTDLSE